MSIYYGLVREQMKLLSNLDSWLDKAGAHAKQKAFDASVFVHARLAPDQYPLVRQVQAACDAAKFAGARLTGKEAPKHPDTETTFDELRARIKSCRAFLETLKESDFEGAGTRIVELPFLEGKLMTGNDYLLEMAQPNFFFHLVTAYAILRHNGVDLGKRDFIGGLTLSDKQ
jgi:hypothetical protein